MARHLGFGLNGVAPDSARALFGARLIVKNDGYVDYLPNRTDLTGEDADKKALIAWLDGKDAAGKSPFMKFKEAASALLKKGDMHTRVAGLHVLYEDDKGKILGNTNASAGYLYVVGYLT